MFFMFLCDLGGPGPLQTINIPIGILRFSGWGRQDPPKPQKYVILMGFSDIHLNLAGFNGN